MRWGTRSFHDAFWPASLSRYMTTDPLLAASPMGNRVLPGTHPSAQIYRKMQSEPMKGFENYTNM